MSDFSARDSCGDREPRANRRSKWIAIALLAATLALAARHLYRSPYAASDLRITPDEVEYAVCARRLATLGRYDLPLPEPTSAGITTVPPRYTPWFSALLAPAYLV